jgi:3-phosphoshikimate 1-carboxyvinyltransferase
MKMKIMAPLQPIRSTITLEGSKSISNRLLLMQALCKDGFNIQNLSPSDDTTTLHRLLQDRPAISDVGAAGTTMRFLTAFYSTLEGERILTGSARMQQRPVGVLVEALEKLGADITYIEKKGYPPIRIKGKTLPGGTIRVRADISSQYISALMMIGPTLKKGLTLILDGKIASAPYIEMTLRTMQELGIDCHMEGATITVKPGEYISKPVQAESDWSAASYHYSNCALSPDSQIRIRGLFATSLQGDSVLPKIYAQLGVETLFEEDEMIIRHTGICQEHIDIDYSNCPDIAQTIAVTCAGLGIPARFTGVESLRIKETDRTAALQHELKKYQVHFHEAQPGEWLLSGKASMQDVEVATYEDHRMAMSFAPLALAVGNVIINEPDVVKKSYPSFWFDMTRLGFGLENV